MYSKDNENMLLHETIYASEVTNSRAFWTIVAVLTKHGKMKEEEYAYPKNMREFIECNRLLKKYPELMDRLNEMRSVDLQWNRLVSYWGMITDLIDAYAMECYTNSKARNSMSSYINKYIKTVYFGLNPRKYKVYAKKAALGDVVEIQRTCWGNRRGEVMYADDNTVKVDILFDNTNVTVVTNHNTVKVVPVYWKAVVKEIFRKKHIAIMACKILEGHYRGDVFVDVRSNTDQLKMLNGKVKECHVNKKKETFVAQNDTCVIIMDTVTAQKGDILIGRKVDRSVSNRTRTQIF